MRVEFSGSRTKLCRLWSEVVVGQLWNVVIGEVGFIVHEKGGVRCCDREEGTKEKAEVRGRRAAPQKPDSQPRPIRRLCRALDVSNCMQFFCA